MQRAIVALLDAFDGRIEFVVDALAQGDLDEPVDDLLIVVPEEHVAAVDQCHLASELVEDAGELVGDIAAAGDHDPLRQLGEVKGFVRADRMLDPVDVGHDRPGPGRDQDLVRRHLFPLASLTELGPVISARSLKIVTSCVVSVSV